MKKFIAIVVLIVALFGVAQLAEAGMCKRSAVVCRGRVYPGRITHTPTLAPVSTQTSSPEKPPGFYISQPSPTPTVEPPPTESTVSAYPPAYP